MPKPIIHDGTKQREMTDAEYTSYLELDAAIKANFQLNADQDASKAAVFKKLGITADEAKLLFGAAPSTPIDTEDE
jgi:hypothetical protein